MTEKPPLFGIWEVEEFTLDGEVRPPLLTDPVRWRRLIIGYSEQFAFVQRMNDERRGFAMQLDPTAKTLLLNADKFTYDTPAPNTLRVDGKLGSRPVSIRMELVDETEFRLVNRGFHWISESPFNR